MALADSFELSTEEDFDVLGSLPNDKDVVGPTSRSAASAELFAEASSDSLRVDLGGQGLVPQPSPLEEVSVVNFGTLRVAESAATDVTSVYSPPSNPLPEESPPSNALSEESPRSAELPGASRERRDEEARVVAYAEEEEENARLIDELQRDNERLAASLAAAYERQKREEETHREALGELETKLNESKTELKLRQSSTITKSEDAQRLKKELALAAECDDLRAELEATKLAARDKQRQLAADLESARTALAKASEARRSADIELEALKRRLASRQQDVLQESSASPLKAQRPDQRQETLEAAEQRSRGLEAELAEERQLHESRIEALRSEFEKLRLAHDRRVRDLRDDDAKALRRTVAELEAKVEAVRSFYTTKLDAEKKKHDAALDAALARQTGVKPKTQALGASNRSSVVADENTAASNTAVSNTAVSNAAPSFKEKALEIEVQRLTELNRKLEEDRLGEVRAAREAEAAKLAAAERRLQDLEDQAQRDAEAADRLRSERDAALEDRETVVEQSRRDSERFHQKVAEARADARAAVDEATEARRRADLAETPHQVAVAALAKKVADLEERNAERQRDVDRAVQDAKAAARVERAHLQARHKDHLAAKDAQLQRFRFELDKLLDALRVELSARAARLPSQQQHRRGEPLLYDDGDDVDNDGAGGGVRPSSQPPPRLAQHRDERAQQQRKNRAVYVSAPKSV